MWKKILTVVLALVMVLSFTACEKEPSAEEIVDGVIESFDKINTYQFNIDEAIDYDFGVDEEGDSFTLSSNGIVDVENRQLRVETSIVDTEQSEIVWGGEQYYIDGILYVKPKDPEGESMWMKEEPPEEWWEGMQQSGLVDSQIGLLEGAQVEVIDSESIDGIDCYVLEVIPDLEQLWQLQASLTFQETIDVTKEYLQEVFHSFSIKQWIAKDTYFLMKAEIDIVTEFPPETPGPSAIDIAMVLLAYNYNEMIPIELPSEAEEAIEMPME